MSLPGHRNVGYVFQGPCHCFPHLSVEANVAYGIARFQGNQSVSQRLLSALESLGILDLRHRRPGQLSGGRAANGVALARALVDRP